MAAAKSVKKKSPPKPKSNPETSGRPRHGLAYVISNNRIPDLFDKLRAAAVPDRLTAEFLRKLGFTSSNDRAFPGLLRKLGFVDASGVPTERYRKFKNRDHSAVALGEGMREAYQPVFAANEDAHELNRAPLAGIIASVTGADQSVVGYITSTFIALCRLATFGAESTPAEAPAITEGDTEDEKPPRPPGNASRDHQQTKSIDFRYNIEIHLPATSDVSVYNAIFHALRTNLLD